ncbi:hypothetical protein Y032_0233g3075 [Ancylostoma ceylanicum]|uniref:Uncharacterized protein n=1 Tax=Ancylostoma ceylanicum TaxID=53326 RepID=A0A016SG50_9BILA|nr:hypothetical protein Y032_0233g3075 [Ancylostoma ceylanicum]
MQKCRLWFFLQSVIPSITPTSFKRCRFDTSCSRMLDPPLRIFRCYICVENRLKAPLTDLSLLVEHLAMHFDFHLFECRGCDQKFMTPFLANFHIKEGRCKREEGELCDEGGPLKVVDLDTVEFEMFCHLQNAVTKCVELMLYELNCGEYDLVSAINANKKLPECPNSPEPIIREERQMQTSPPLDPAPTTTSTPPLILPPPPPPPALNSSSDMSIATTCTVESATKSCELADGCSLISDDEEEEEERPYHSAWIRSPRPRPHAPQKFEVGVSSPAVSHGITYVIVISSSCRFFSCKNLKNDSGQSKQPPDNVEADDGLSTISNSPSSTVAAQSSPVQSPQQSPPHTPLHSPPSTSTSSIPSLLSLKFNHKLDFDIPPRRDIRQPVFKPDRAAAPPPTNYAEADSSSSSAAVPPQQPFFFQAPPPKPKRAVSTQNLNSLNESVYPVLAPVYSGGVQVFPGQPQLVHPQRIPGYSGQIQPAPEEVMPPAYQTAPCYGMVPPPTVAEVSSSTSGMPHHDERRLSDNLPVFPPHHERELSPLRVESPVQGHLPHDFLVDGNSSTGDRSESQLSRMSLEDDGYTIDCAGSPDLDISVPPRPGESPFPLPLFLENPLLGCGSSFPGEELDHRPRIRSGNEEWVGYETRITEQRPGGVTISHRSQRISRNPRGEKQRHSYAIQVMQGFDPHTGTVITPRRRRNSSGRRSRALSRDRSSHARSRTTGPPRSRKSRSRSPRSRSPRSRSPPRSSRQRMRSPSNSPVRRSGSVERSRSHRRHGSGREKFEIFPASILDGDMPSSSRDPERPRHRSRSRRRGEDREEDDDELEDERPRKHSSSSKSSSKSAASDIEVLEVIQHAADRASRPSGSSKPSHFADWKKKQSKLSRIPIPPPLPRRK